MNLYYVYKGLLFDLLLVHLSLSLRLLIVGHNNTEESRRNEIEGVVREER